MFHNIWQRVAVWTMFLAVGSVVTITGCEKTPRDRLTDGKRALADGRLQAAERHLDAALEADPELMEARRLMATARMEDGDFETAEGLLEQIWEARGFDREGELSADERQMRQMLNEQFGELYRRWAASIDTDEAPEKFEEVARAGLERNSRDGRLNTMLVDFYNERADRHVERGDKRKAAEMLERIDELHRFPDTRRESRQRARRLRREAFTEEALRRFETELRPELIENGTYEPDTTAFVLETEQPLDGGLEPGDDGALEQARRTAVQALAPTLSQFAVSMADLEPEDVEAAAVDVPELELRDEEFRPGQYEMTVAVDRDALVDMAFEYAEYHRARAEEPAPEEGDEGAGPVALGDELRLDTSALDNTN